ncbi:CobW family GTP-binding protein [Magnetococcus sp. PR-3]|uniref:CobW family GTP-binding protein n=1 Tax=Magnetococcus sp. PR-3 TaxID=3120355 RepID=UPI002FCDECA3
MSHKKTLPVSILTGFLGSGKTTLLNHLIKQPQMKETLVLINEFGQIGIDHDLVAESLEEVAVELSSGCLCCSIRGDLVKTLRDAQWRFAREGKPWFKRVVIETTGLADPAPILHTLMTDEVIVRQYHLEGVLTVVDAVNGSNTLDQQEESRKQVAVADRLLISKTDLADADTLQALQHHLRQFNPAAPQIVVTHGEYDPEQLWAIGPYHPDSRGSQVQAWLQAEAYHIEEDDHHHHHHDVNRHNEQIRAICITLDEPVHAQALEQWLELLLMLKGPDFLRIKGMVNVVGFEGPMVIHGVQHIFHNPVQLPTWPSEDHRSRMVFITRDMEEAQLRGTLDILEAANRAISSK